MPHSRLQNGPGLLIIVAALALAGCGGGVPEFLGRDGSGAEGTWSVRGEPAPEAVPMALSEVTVEPALTGTILRVESIAPAQGYYSARLEAVGDGRPDQAGVIGFVITAIPPACVTGIGPERTRTLRAAVFVPNRAKRQVKTVRLIDSTGVRTVQIR